MIIRTYIVILGLVYHQYLFSGSTTVYPFEINFKLANEFNVEAELMQSCRKDKLILDDEDYSTIHSINKKYPLDISQENNSDENRSIAIILKSKKTLSLEDIFDDTERCLSEVSIKFQHKSYAVGWAGLRDKPLEFTIKFHYTNGSFKKGDSVLDMTEALSVMQSANFSLRLKSIPAFNQVNAFLLKDGSRFDLVQPQRLLMNPDTQLPYTYSR